MARQFIVKEQDRYYVCEVTIEYDPSQAETAEDRRGIELMASMMDQARNAGAILEACSMEGGSLAFAPLNTDPSV